MMNDFRVARYDIGAAHPAVLRVVRWNHKTAINVVTAGRDFVGFVHLQNVIGWSERPLRWRLGRHGSLGRIPFATTLGQPLFDHALFLIGQGIVTQKFAETSLWLPRRH